MPARASATGLRRRGRRARGRRRRRGRSAARGRSRGRRWPRGPCGPRPAPRPRRTGRCEAPTTAAGLLRSGDSASGRESQSRAFLSWPGIEWLYSGVATRTASASAIASNSACTDVGAGVLVVLVERRDRLQPVEDRRARPRAAAGRPRPGGAWRCGSRRAGCRRGRGPSSDYARASSRLTMQLDLVGEREAALGQRRVPARGRTRCGRRSPRARCRSSRRRRRSRPAR